MSGYWNTLCTKWRCITGRHLLVRDAVQVQCLVCNHRRPL